MTEDLSRTDMTASHSLTKIYRLSKIVDIPSGIEAMGISPKKLFLSVGRLDGSVEVWTTDSWIQLIKMTGIKGKFTLKYKIAILERYFF